MSDETKTEGLRLHAVEPHPMGAVVSVATPDGTPDAIQCGAAVSNIAGQPPYALQVTARSADLVEQFGRLLIEAAERMRAGGVS